MAALAKIFARFLHSHHIHNVYNVHHTYLEVFFYFPSDDNFRSDDENVEVDLFISVGFREKFANDKTKCKLLRCCWAEDVERSQDIQRVRRRRC